MRTETEVPAVIPVLESLAKLAAAISELGAIVPMALASFENTLAFELLLNPREKAAPKLSPLFLAEPLSPDKPLNAL
jgi:hypothetical protein